ncbi:MAG: DNA-3-methyladenine glycosylase [Clostridia bacterium]
MKKLSRNYYNRDTLEVARDLLGKYLVHEINKKKLVGKIVEVEAYKGLEDKAAHSYSGKITKRNKIMFGPPGFSYVYHIYGMYQCMNVVVEREGKPCAILIRAIEPIDGNDMMAQNRFNKSYNELDDKMKTNVSNGPGKLCIALGITIEQYGEDLCGNILYITEGDKIAHEQIVATTRINIDYAEEAIHYPWRFYIKDNRFISRK